MTLSVSVVNSLVDDQMPIHGIIYSNSDTSHKCHGISNHRQLNYFFISMVRLTTKESSASVVFMMTSSNGNIFRVTGPLSGEFTGPGEFPAQRPVTRNFDVFFDLRVNKPLRKQPWGWWFEMSSWSLWRQCNVARGIHWSSVDSLHRETAMWQVRADSRFKSSQWETALLCNNVSHWLGASLESDLESVSMSYSIHD